MNLALDAAGELVYLAPTRVNLQLTLERWPGDYVRRDARARDRRGDRMKRKRPARGRASSIHLRTIAQPSLKVPRNR